MILDVLTDVKVVVVEFVHLGVQILVPEVVMVDVRGIVQAVVKVVVVIVLITIKNKWSF